MMTPLPLRTFRRMLGAAPSDLALLKRVSMGFSLESDQRCHRAARAIGGAAAEERSPGLETLNESGRQGARN